MIGMMKPKTILHPRRGPFSFSQSIRGHLMDKDKVQFKENNNKAGSGSSNSNIIDNRNDDKVLVSGNSSKAGLPSSLSEINSLISEASKDSRFTAAQERKMAELEAKISVQREELNKILAGEPVRVSRARRSVDLMMKEFEAEQVAQFEKSEEYCWVCVDMDAFYASVEALDEPELKSVPMAVGGMSMLSTANYEARKFGVSAAMPGYIALKLCPQLKIVPLRFDRYRELSGQVSQILAQYDPNLSMWSLDEAFLRLKKEGGIDGKRNKSFAEIVEEMRRKVFEGTGLTCSAGIACNPLLAKLASNFRKPDGQFEIDRVDRVAMRRFLSEQPVRKLSGIGKVMSVTLERVLQVETVGDLYEKRHLLPLVFKDKTVQSLLMKSIGHAGAAEEFIGDADANQKSVSCERTFTPGLMSDFLDGHLLTEIANHLMNDCRAMGVVEVGRVGVKVKCSDFRVFTRERSIGARRTDKADFYNLLLSTSMQLMKEFEEYEVRLVGIRLSALKYQQSNSSKGTTTLETWLNNHNNNSNNSNNCNNDNDGVTKCPICDRILRDDLRLINNHIDDCLTRSAIKEGLN